MLSWDEDTIRVIRGRGLGSSPVRSSFSTHSEPTDVAVKHAVDGIMAHDGLALSSVKSPADREAALRSVQAALDSIRRQEATTPSIGRRGARWLRGWSVACMAGGVAVMVARHDALAALTLFVGAGAFQLLGLYAIHLGKRLQAAEDALLRQMCELGKRGTPDA